MTRFAAPQAHIHNLADRRARLRRLHNAAATCLLAGCLAGMVLMVLILAHTARLAALALPVTLEQAAMMRGM